MKFQISSLKTPKYFSMIRTLLIVGLSLVFVHTLHQPVSAQTPSTWQQGATGLKTQSNPDKKTAGLTFTVQDQGWPFLTLQGGVQDEGLSRIGGPIGVELGLVKNPSVTSSAFSSESADWAGDQVVFNGGTSAQMTMWVSRLSPAVLIQSSSTVLRFFAGNVNTYVDFNQTGLAKKSAPSFPKYVAFSSGGQVQISPLSSSTLSLPTLDNNWILVWYGANSHFHDTKVPMLYPYPSQKGCCLYGESSMPISQGYQADAPILIAFQNPPSSIARSPEGGIDLSFSTGVGYTTLLPLFGRDHPNSTATEGWASSGAVPATVMAKINFWVSHLCSFPSDASESYSYDPNSDTATISENVTYVAPVCAGGATGIAFAPVPPMLGLAGNTLKVNFSGTVVDAYLPTEFGPTTGIENTDSYTWSITGLKKYTDSSRVITNTGQAPAALMQQLTSQVDRITAAGHFAPWIIEDKWTYDATFGDIYWLSPADNIYVLSEIIPALPDPQKTNLINYLKSERANYPPETVYNLTLYQGTLRQDYNPPNQTASGGRLSDLWANRRPELFMTRVWLYDFFALSRYYDITGEAIPSSVMTAAIATLDNDMSQQDWATMYWFKGFDDRRIPVVNANRHLGGLIGLTKLAKQTGDSATENLARSLLAKALVLRVAMAQYPRYLYANNLVTLPADPAWQPKYSAGYQWTGVIYNYNWTQPQDDARQVTTLNQFGLILYDSSGFMPPFTGWTYQRNTISDAYLVAFRDMVPEVGRLLADFAKADVDIYPTKLEATLPHWYKAFSDAILGNEHGVAYPVDSYQIFMAKAWIDNNSPQTLSRYVDIPWLASGDFFYVHKLAEVIKAYRGIVWQ
jgi:hypothetical protein